MKALALLAFVVAEWLCSPVVKFSQLNTKVFCTGHSLKDLAMQSVVRGYWIPLLCDSQHMAFGHTVFDLPCLFPSLHVVEIKPTLLTLQSDGVLTVEQMIVSSANSLPLDLLLLLRSLM